MGKRKHKDEQWSSIPGWGARTQESRTHGCHIVTMRERLRRFRNASPDSDSVAPDPIAATVFSVISYA